MADRADRFLDRPRQSRGVHDRQIRLAVGTFAGAVELLVQRAGAVTVFAADHLLMKDQSIDAATGGFNPASMA